MTEQEIADNFARVRGTIREAERASGRAEGSVRLCAVSKFHPVEDVMAALKAGQLLFGENRVQEACAKFTSVRGRRSPQDALPELHIIGTLQSNKVRRALEVASCIQSVDRDSILEEIERQCVRANRTVSILFELHTGEDSKSGYPDVDSLRRSVERCASGGFPHLVPSGVMTMAPFTDDEGVVRGAFRAARSALARLRADFPALPLRELSMGMSGDYRMAIEEGSTMVRIGTALFGERQAARG